MTIALQEVVGTYVLGGNSTDVHREAMTANLVGAKVSWRLKVFEMAKGLERNPASPGFWLFKACNNSQRFALVARLHPSVTIFATSGGNVCE